MQRYEGLAKRRAEARWPGYAQPEDYGYDFRSFVSPYTKTAGNRNADVLLVLQDWISHDGLIKRGVDQDIQRLGHDPSIRTNKTLKRLLRRYLDLALTDVYGTNAFVFIKPGGMSAGLPFRDLTRSIRQFTKLEIEIVQPKVVLALGSAVASALKGCEIDCVALPHPASRIGSEAMHEAWDAATKRIAAVC